MKAEEEGIYNHRTIGVSVLPSNDLMGNGYVEKCMSEQSFVLD